MVKIDKHIEIVSSTQPGLSSMSLKSYQAVRAVLDQSYTRVGITIVNNLSDLEALVAIEPDLIFLGMHFIPSNPTLGLRDPNKIWLSQYFGEHGITHTGSDYKAHELGNNKELAKERVISAELKTARYRVIEKDEPLTTEVVDLSYPLFVKPTDRGGGLGIDNASVVYDFDQLQAKVNSLVSNYDSDALVEEYLPGREFSVGILQESDSQEYSVMPIELIAPINKSGERILSAQVKSEDSEYNLKVTDMGIKDAINALALNVFQALNARDYGRIDIRLDAHGTPHFLEANLLPSLLDGYGNFPKTCMLNIGLSYELMILHIVELAFSRQDNFIKDLVLDNDVQIPREIVLEAV